MTEEEEILRNNIRHLIRYVKQKKLHEEDELRTIIQEMVGHELKNLAEASVPDVKPAPNKSTGINVLEELLKKIIPVLEVDYKSLTTNIEQRASFRAHIINAVINALAPAELNTDAGDEEATELQEADIEISVDDDLTDDNKFIDIRTDAEKAADEDEEEEDPRETFGSGVQGADETGRNMAYESFKKIQSSIIDSYELLSNDEDQELFYDYLIANLKLYFNKFETELADTVEEPTNQVYDDAAAEAPAAGEEEDMALQEYINSL